jgi:hypothetical protein
LTRNLLTPRRAITDIAIVEQGEDQPASVHAIDAYHPGWLEAIIGELIAEHGMPVTTRPRSGRRDIDSYPVRGVRSP